ncbi:MAG TPA: hypothetical protein VLE43_17230 [Candidatus Saccharimonadia bacterium]|nr:hypothetical protein [Candidatus Saccharimonadia bacterium]
MMPITINIHPRCGNRSLIKTKEVVMIGLDDVASMNAALERCEGYLTLGMLHEARLELRSVPEELRGSFPFMATCMNLCLQFHWWEEGAELGRNLVQRWPGNHEVRVATAHCMMHSGRELDGILLLRGIDVASRGGTNMPETDPGWSDR